MIFEGVLLAEGYGLWVIADLWVMVCKYLRTELVDQKCYGISGFVGYLGWLWGVDCKHGMVAIDNEVGLKRVDS